MKARENNGIITIFRSLPESWDGSSGHIVNFRNASTEVLESEGFFDVVKPSYDSRIEELGEIEFDSDDNQFTYPKSDKTISETLAELKAQKKQAVKDLANNELAKTDWYVTRNADLGTAIPDDVNTERASIRTKVDERETEIDALTTKKNVVIWTPILFDPPSIDDLV